MSGIPETRKLWITPLSPVHMGTDEDYSPTGYVIEGNALYEFDHSALKILPEIERKSLDRLLSGKATQDMLKQVQAFFYRNREWLIPAAVNVVHVSDELAAMYKARIGKAANVESRGREVQNRLEIERAAYNPVHRRLFLAGSGMKGAMRTALLDAINQGRRTERGEGNRELQQRLFRFTMQELQKDPMRLVQVGDCAWHGLDELNSAEVLFAVNRKKIPVKKDGNLLQSQAEEKGLYQMLECATPFRFRAFQGLLNIIGLSNLKSDKGKLPELKFSFGDIATACNRFYQPIFNRETELLKKRGYLDTDWRRSVERLLADPGVRQRLDSNNAFLLRVGRHSGAESVTINGVRSIKIMKGRGENPGWEPEAKTVWLSTGDRQDKRYLRPFGWLLVEMTELDEAPPVWPEAEQIMSQHVDQMRQWLDGVKEKQQELGERTRAIRTRLEEEERKKREMEAEEKYQKEEKARALAKKLERLPDDAVELEKQRAGGRWEDTNYFLKWVEEFLESHNQFTDEAINLLKEEMARRWKGIMNNPDATQGKKNKPKYKPRPKALAVRIRAL